MIWNYWSRLEGAYATMDWAKFDKIMSEMNFWPKSLSRQKFFLKLWDLNELDVLEFWVWTWYNFPYYRGLSI